MYALWTYVLQNINSEYLSDKIMAKLYFFAYVHSNLPTISIFYLYNKNIILKSHVAND